MFPRRNLPGLAEDWGRAIENRIVEGESQNEQTDQRVDNGLRATNGQLAVMSNQVVDLSDQVTELSKGRVTRTVNTADTPFSYSTSGAATALRLTVDIPLPGAYAKPRSAMVVGSFLVQRVSGDGTNMYAELVLGGTTIWRSSTIPVGLGGSVPPGWAGGAAVSFFAAFTTSTLLPATLPLQLKLWSVDYNAVSNSLILKNLSSSVTYSDPV